jgi:hypothetical protein
MLFDRTHVLKDIGERAMPARPTSTTIARLAATLTAGLILVAVIGDANAALMTGVAESNAGAANITAPLNMAVTKEPAAPKVRVAPCPGSCGNVGAGGFHMHMHNIVPAPRVAPIPKALPVPKTFPIQRIIRSG